MASPLEAIIHKKTLHLCLLCFVEGGRSVSGNAIATNKMIRTFVDRFDLDDNEETLKTALQRLEEDLREHERRT